MTPPTDQRFILIAEDNAGDVSLLELALTEQQAGLAVTVCSDGEKAIHFIEKVECGMAPFPAVVVLDLNLPRIDGREVLRRIRQNDAWQSVPVIVFSSSDSARDREVTATLGATLYLRKPSNLEDFLQVGKLLKDYGESRAAAVN